MKRSKRLSRHAQALGNVVKSRLFRLADALAPETEKGALDRGIRHFPAEVPQPSFEGRRITGRLGVKNFRNVS